MSFMLVLTPSFKPLETKANLFDELLCVHWADCVNLTDTSPTSNTSVQKLSLMVAEQPLIIGCLGWAEAKPPSRRWWDIVLVQVQQQLLKEITAGRQSVFCSGLGFFAYEGIKTPKMQRECLGVSPRSWTRGDKGEEERFDGMGKSPPWWFWKDGTRREGLSGCIKRGQMVPLGGWWVTDILTEVAGGWVQISIVTILLSLLAPVSIEGLSTWPQRHSGAFSSSWTLLLPSLIGWLAGIETDEGGLSALSRSMGFLHLLCLKNPTTFGIWYHWQWLNDQSCCMFWMLMRHHPAVTVSMALLY